MKPGDVFNPRFEACGFHPEEIVSRRRDLTDGQKYLYHRLVGWARSTDGQRPNERAGEVWRSHENIAIELGKSSKQIGRALAKLESKRLINHRKRDGRKSNTYVFLFHEDFERTQASSQTVEAREFERTRMSAQKAGEAPLAENLNGHARPVRTSLNGHPCPSNQKEFNQKDGSSSSAAQDCELEVEADPAATTNDRSPDGANSLQQAWTDPTILEAREAMQRHFGSPLLPDLGLTRQVLAYMEGLEDVRLWLLDLSSRRVKPRGWGLYRADAVTWPSRRPDVAGQVKAARIARQWREAEEARQFAGADDSAIAVSPGPIAELADEVAHPAPPCVGCEGTGLRHGASDHELYDWCACVAGARRQTEAPDTVDRANATVFNLRRRFAASAEKTAQAA